MVLRWIKENFLDTRMNKKAKAPTKRKRNPSRKLNTHYEVRYRTAEMRISERWSRLSEQRCPV